MNIDRKLLKIYDIKRYNAPQEAFRDDLALIMKMKQLLIKKPYYTLQEVNLAYFIRSRQIE